ncbi:hypothetical protein D3C85_1869530 [compost metagenome]
MKSSAPISIPFRKFVDLAVWLTNINGMCAVAEFLERTDNTPNPSMCGIKVLHKIKSGTFVIASFIPVSP